jgi:hypothetical protein
MSHAMLGRESQPAVRARQRTPTTVSSGSLKTDAAHASQEQEAEWVAAGMAGSNGKLNWSIGATETGMVRRAATAGTSRTAVAGNHYNWNSLNKGDVDELLWCRPSAFAPDAGRVGCTKRNSTPVLPANEGRRRDVGAWRKRVLPARFEAMKEARDGGMKAPRRGEGSAIFLAWALPSFGSRDLGNFSSRGPDVPEFRRLTRRDGCFAQETLRAKFDERERIADGNAPRRNCCGIADDPLEMWYCSDEFMQPIERGPNYGRSFTYRVPSPRLDRGTARVIEPCRNASVDPNKA